MAREEDIRRDERIRQDEANKQQFTGCLKVFGMILAVSLAMGICGAIFCGCSPQPPSPRPKPTATYSNPAVPTPTPIPTKSPPRQRTNQLVSACATAWDSILYVAEGYEMDGFSKGDALTISVVMTAELTGVPETDLWNCVDTLTAAGYTVSQGKLYPPR